LKFFVFDFSWTLFAWRDYHMKTLSYSPSDWAELVDPGAIRWFRTGGKSGGNFLRITIHFKLRRPVQFVDVPRFVVESLSASWKASRGRRAEKTDTPTLCIPPMTITDEGIF